MSLQYGNVQMDLIVQVKMNEKLRAMRRNQLGNHYDYCVTLENKLHLYYHIHPELLEAILQYNKRYKRRLVALLNSKTFPDAQNIIYSFL